MRAFHFVFRIICLTLATSVVVWGQDKDSDTDLAANAAIQYWQAFAQMPKLDAEQEKMLEQWNAIPLDAAAQKLIDASHSSLMYLHRGAQLKRCDWGLDYNDGISLMMPHLSKARDLARLAALRARQEFEQGNRKGARADAAAMTALARHVGRDPIMVSLLVQYAIEGATVDLVAPYVPELKASYAQSMQLFGELPQAATLQQAVFTEKKFICEWIVAKLQDEEQRKKGAALELWKKFLDGPAVPESLKKNMSLEEILAQVASLAPAYDQLAKLVVLPKGEFDAQYPRFLQKTEAEIPLAKVLLPNLHNIIAKSNRNQARFAMLLAAIAVAEGGAEKLHDLKDPFGTGPFEYRKLENGFELKSKLIFEDQPVTLQVGRNKSN